MADRRASSRRNDEVPAPSPSFPLDVEEDPGYHRRNEMFERAALVVMVLIVIAAVLGVFGHGPLSREVVGIVGGPLWIEYPRVGRSGAGEVIHVHFGTGASRESESRVWVDRRLLDALRVEQIMPEPERSEAGAEGTLFVFAKHDMSRPASVTFHVLPQRAGSVKGRMGLPGGDVLGLSLFLFP